ncbi:hypothetical protein [Nitrospira sp. Nam80]
MPGRKLLYMLRRPLTAGQTDDVFLGGRPFAQETDISVVLFDSSITDDRQFPGRIFFLQEGADPGFGGRGVQGISYADLLKLIFEADATIVV